MNDFIGKNCPYCKTDFTADDEIVICSNCDMPHHKDCWIENQGCTTFGCLGTIKNAGAASTVTATEITFDDAAPAATPSVIYCTNCGAQNNSTFSFCSKCGTALTTAAAQTPPVYTAAAPVYTQTPPQPEPAAYAPPASNSTYAYTNQPPVTNSAQGTYQPFQNSAFDGELVHLVGQKSEYYIPKFHELKSQNKQTSWNWAAFLFTPYWLIYRKMYGYGFAFLAAAFLLVLINTTFTSLLSLAGYIVFGIFANNIYMKSLEAKANQAKVLTEPYKSQFILKNGGTNSTATILTIIGYSLLVFLLSA